MKARLVILALFSTALLLLGCDDETVVSPELTSDAWPAEASSAPGEIAAASETAPLATASGGGHFLGEFFFGVPVQFAFTAVQRDASGDANGTYQFSTTVDGLAIEIHGRITCMTTDPANPHRAWMGGVITKNESEHPLYTGPTSQVGRDSWFRVVDYGEGANASQADRTTFIFVEPTGGFTSAKAFCERQLWLPEDRVTNPLLNGNIQVIH